MDFASFRQHAPSEANYILYKRFVLQIKFHFLFQFQLFHQKHFMEHNKLYLFNSYPLAYFERKLLHQQRLQRQSLKS